MTTENELPPLPADAADWEIISSGGRRAVWTATHMMDYARAAIAADRKRHDADYPYDAIERLKRHVAELSGAKPEMSTLGIASALGYKDRLEAEVATLRARLEVCEKAREAAVSHAQWQAVTNTELNDLRARLEAAEKDAARYRELKRHAVREYPVNEGLRGWRFPVLAVDKDCWPTLDERIDAALQSTGSSEGK